MRTNFFQALQRLQGAGGWVINVNSSNENELIVSVLLKSSETEKYKSELPPMVFKGTAQEIDEGILEGLLQPVAETKSLFANVSAYHKGLADAKAKLITKPKSEKQVSAKPISAEAKSEVTASTPIRPKLEDIIKEISTLNAGCKYAEAVAMLPHIEDYPDKKAEIEKLKTDLEWRMKQLTLL